MPVGRPTNYTPELAAFICDELAEGRSLRSICAADDMPKVSTIGHWRAKHPEFAALYAHARELAGDAEADLAKAYSEQTHVLLPNGMYAPIDPQRARLMADTAKWRSSRLNAKAWGDKVAVEHSGSISFSELTEEDLLAEVLELVSAGKLALPNGARIVFDQEPEADDFDPEEFA